MIRHSDKFLPALVALTLLCASLPFGGVTRGASALLQISAFVALALALLSPAGARPLRCALPAAAALAAIALFGLLQSLPWPQPVVRALSPAHAELAAPVRAQSSSLDAAEASRGAAPRLSVAPRASRRAALAWASTAAMLAAAAAAGRRRSHRRWVGGAIVAAALFQVLYGVPRWLSSSGTIWGLEVPGMRNRLRGTFVNPDHLATYLGLALAVAFAWSWWALLHAQDETEAERRLLLLAPPVIVWLLLFVALAFTGSRAGLAAAFVGVGAQSLAARGRGGRATGAILGGTAVALGVLGVLIIGAREGFGRLLSTSAYEVTWSARLEAYRASLDLWSRFRLTGSGLGTFRDAFPLVQPAELPGVWSHAHSDPLELAVTTGVIGPLLLVAGLVVLARALPLGLSRRLRSEDRAMVLAAVGGLVTAGTHELVDFGLTMPANALTLAALCGAALAVVAQRSAAWNRTAPGRTVPPVSGSTSSR